MAGSTELLPEERAKYYRALAAEALKAAHFSNTEPMHTQLVLMAAEWERLADRLEILVQ